jgi:hypothetical protein
LLYLSTWQGSKRAYTAQRKEKMRDRLLIFALALVLAACAYLGYQVGRLMRVTQTQHSIIEQQTIDLDGFAHTIYDQQQLIDQCPGIPPVPRAN